MFDDSARTVTLKKAGGTSVFRNQERGFSLANDSERGHSFDFDFEQVPLEQEILKFFKTVYDTAQVSFFLTIDYF